MNQGNDFDPSDPGRLRLLANYLSGRDMGVGIARPDEAPYTDGHTIFVSATAGPAEQRREAIVQAALLGAGSFDAGYVSALRRNPRASRRYLALEGYRVLNDLRDRVPIAAGFGSIAAASTQNPTESLRVAHTHKKVADAPVWFGALRPWRLVGAAKSDAAAAMAASDKELRLEFKLTDIKEADEDDEENSEESKILNSLQNPLFNSQLTSKMAQKILNMSRSLGQKVSGGEMAVGSIRRVDSVGPNARPSPVPLNFFEEDTPGRAKGFGGALYPEWDFRSGRYRREWCRVVDYPLWTIGVGEVGTVDRDEVLRRRLARLGLGPKVVRRRPDGEDLDTDALIDLAVDLHAGHSSNDHIYLERRKIARNLGVLILLDVSGSATESDLNKRTVHDIQRRAAATLTHTLEELGDRVAIYGFRSQGRSSVYMLALKPFSQRFGARGRAQLNRLEPGGYTRLGAAIRHSGELLKNDAGTPNRLLLVISDGFPYDDGYESRYAEADTAKALEEVRGSGIGCLCLSIGASTPDDTLNRVFGSASHANASTLAELSPRMDELVLGALKELAVGQARR